MDPIIIKLLAAVVLGFVLTAALGKVVIPALRRMKAGQSIKEDGPTWHMAKQGTPTMGGVMFILAVMVTVLVLNASAILAGDLTSVFVLLFSLVFGLIGMVDDYAKIKKKENTGLTASQKFLLQLAAAVLFTVLLRNFGILSPNLYIPFLGIEWKLPWVVYMIFAAFVITGCVNSVNITDGVDGLASSVTLVVSVFFTACFTYAHLMWNTTGSAGMAVFAAALVGGLVGFLVYNFHPAKVFMGDTGSLFLGGAVCGMAFALDMPLILILVGIIYIAETLSDIIQVGYFKLTHGKRIFRMAPLHHHLEMGGWSEKKLCYVFAGITLVCCILAFIGVMGRFPAL
ncbi:MAG: phospho-N-acetylmuramoyl-pentapeptide-transferase [Ruminiclostridium sp.]|nr:phospho-N-acetylmuramoyl-pentapeptide-transferase [Ruminiclostridium sp.]